MAEYYRATFTIDSSNDAPDAQGIDLMENIEDIVSEWAKEHLSEPDQDTNNAELKDQNGGTFHIDRGKIDRSGFCRLVLEHPDSDNEAQTWRTDFRLATEGDRVGIEVEVRRIGDSDEPLGGIGNASRPRVVETLFRDFKCSFDGQPLTDESEHITPADSEYFVNNLLTNPSRRMPVIVVTENRYGGIFMNANRLQSRLLGLVNVYTYGSETARTVNRELGDRLGCWDGAIRVYRPGCSRDDASRQNAYWTWRHMNYITNAKGWEELLLEIGDECLIHLLPQAGPRLYEEVSGQVRRARYERLLERFKSAAQDESAYQELLNEATGAVADYQLQNEELSQRYIELEKDNEHLRAQVEQLGISLSYRESEESQSEDIQDDIRPEFNSVHDVVKHAMKYMNGIRFFSYAQETAKGSQFPRPDEVYGIFEALDACAVERAQDTLGKSVQEWFAEQGVVYASNESESTMGKYGDKRTFFDNLNKRRTKMPAHIKIGGGLGEHNQLRIHLFWEKNEQKWLIGYIGRHRPTSSG